MGWFGKLTFGTAGFLLGGPIYAIAGAALGHHLVDKDGNRSINAGKVRSVEQAQAAYFICMFSIIGKLAKSDGTVNSKEIAVFERFLSSLNIPEEEKQFAREIFDEAKDSPYAITDFAEQMYIMNARQPTILISFIDLLFKVAAADGVVHPNEEDDLRRISEVFHFSEQQYNSIKSCYLKDTDRYYKILNCTPASSDLEVKASYKKLVKDYHPDTVMAKGLPEEFVQFAKGRFQEIHEAYEKIRKERSF